MALASAIPRSMESGSLDSTVVRQDVELVKIWNGSEHTMFLNSLVEVWVTGKAILGYLAKQRIASIAFHFKR